MVATGKRIQREFSKTVGDVIRGEYTKRRMSLEMLAAASGETVATVQRVLAGRSPMTIERFELYCSAIGLDVGAVLDEAVEMYGGEGRIRDEVEGRVGSVGSSQQDDDADVEYDEPLTRKRQVGMAAKRGVRKADQ